MVLDNDSYTEVTANSCCGNFIGSCIGAILGLVLFIAAFPLLWWNEQRSLEREKALWEAQQVVVTVPANSVNPADEGKLVYLTGEATTGGTVADAVFGITRRVLKLRRTVEMYQWDETKDSRTIKDFGGGSHTITTYHYQKKWSDPLISSGSFRKPQGHTNPATKPFETKVFTAKRVHVGAFKLPPVLLEKMTWFADLPVTDDMLEQVPEARRDTLQVAEGRFYRGKQPDTPQVGDVRIAFAVILPGPVSLVAQQAGASFAPYPTTHGEVVLLASGTVAIANMFHTARVENSVKTWVLRGVFWLVMLFGICLVFGPTTAVANIIPILGDITDLVFLFTAACISAALSLLTIAVAWVVLRPLAGIPLLGASLVLLGLGLRVRHRGRGKRRRRRCR